MLTRRWSDLLWSGIAGLFPRAAVLIAGIYVARSLGNEDFASFSIGLSTVLMTGSLLGSTLTTTAMRFVPLFASSAAATPGTGARAFVSLSAAVAVATGAAIGLLAPAAAALFGLPGGGASLFLVAAVVALLAVAQGASMGLLLGSARFRTSAIVQGAAFVLFAAALPALCSISGASGALAAIGVFYGASLLAGMGAHKSVRPIVPDEERGGRAPVRLGELIGYAVPLLIATGLISPIVWLCNLLLARVGAGYSEIAAFNAAYYWFAVASYAPAVLAQVEFVHLSRTFAGGVRHDLAEAVRRFRRTNAIALLPIALVMGLLAQPLVAAFGQTTPQAATCLRLMLAGMFLMGLGDPARLFLSAAGRVWHACMVNVVWGLSVGATAILAADRGAVGLGYAFAVGYLVYLVFGTIVLHREMKPRSHD